MTKPLQVMSGEELMDMDYKPIKFAVREFLPQGLAILAGAPKTGKSFFALWLCLCVAKGESVWDCETAKGTVLYLCLEDNQSRLQNRTLTITDDAPANLFFVGKLPALEKGWKNRFESFYQSRKKQCSLSLIRCSASENKVWITVMGRTIKTSNLSKRLLMNIS